MTKPVDAIARAACRAASQKIDLALDRIQRLLAALGNPQQQIAAGDPCRRHQRQRLGLRLSARHAGSRGQGVHVHTSPHLVRFHERIRLGRRAEASGDDEELSATLEECEAVNAGAPDHFFRDHTAAACSCFSRHPADVLVLEVGLGGRLDATNVVDNPAATVITPVGIDHTEFLGDTLAKIAAEKAGIIKRGAPAIVAAQQREALPRLTSGGQAQCAR